MPLWIQLIILVLSVAAVIAHFKLRASEVNGQMMLSHNCLLITISATRGKGQHKLTRITVGNDVIQRWSLQPPEGFRAILFVDQVTEDDDQYSKVEAQEMDSRLTCWQGQLKLGAGSSVSIELPVQPVADGALEVKISYDTVQQTQPGIKQTRHDNLHLAI